jgi:hypothetical protein
VNVTAEPTAWPVANDDAYTIKAKFNQRIIRTLFVLANYAPRGFVKINKVETSGSYGRLTMRDASVLYEVDSFDAMEHTDTFW